MRRFCLTLLLTLVAWGCLGLPAIASVPHTVRPGETLWSIAAASNFTTRSLAAANGLSPDARVVAGGTIRIPSVAEAAGALAQVRPATPEPSAPRPMGAYTVRPGDSLSAIAVRSRVPMSQIAYMNGLNPRAPLLAGTVVKLPTGAPAPAPRAAPAPTPRVVPHAAPQPTSGRVTASQVGQIATTHGVPASLANAIAWQESGFNNRFVSSANARGVMQIMPGTWSWIQRRLAARPLNPSSSLDNVHAGSMLLGSLLRETGGNSALAAGAYYQGLGSVRRVGFLPETRRYVRNVQALQSRFGGR
jgi:N-acetylmuramoyl-L-alanine amidase